MAAHDSLHQAYKYGGAMAGSAIGTVNGPSFDCRGMEEVLVILAVGDAGAGTLDVKVEESASGGGSWSDIVGASFTQVVNADDNKTFIGRIIVNKDRTITGGRLQFLRITGVVATAAVNYGCCFIGAGLHDKPVAQEQTVAFNFDETAD